MDIKFTNERTMYNYCSRAIIRQDEKLLILCVNDAAYYHLPGGHVEIGETSQNALIREIKEEVGIEITLDKLVVVSEEFYHKNDLAIHSVNFYYIANPQAPVKPENSVRWEQGKTRLNKIELRWVTMDELKNIDLRPARIKNLIMANDFKTLQHIID